MTTAQHSLRNPRCVDRQAVRTHKKEPNKVPRATSSKQKV